MRTTSLILSLLVVLGSTWEAGVRADTFGNGTNSFEIAFVTIGNPGNAPDTTGNPNPAGSVSYGYRMGKFEISEQMIDKANSLGGLGIVKHFTHGADKPANGVSWNEAARFVNWLNTSTGSPPAYKFAVQAGQGGYDANSNIELWDSGDTGFNAANPYRNSLARYFLPSIDEWYKSAYFDPVNNAYFDFPTGSNSTPSSTASGTNLGTAVFNGQMGPADVMLAGGLSPYGTMGQGGNAYELEETEYDTVNNSSSSLRGVRGGYWGSDSLTLSSSNRFSIFPTSTYDSIGFRVASLLAGLFADYNGNGAVDAADYVLWRNGGPLQNEISTIGSVTADDYVAWRVRFGNSTGMGSLQIGALVPEPSVGLLHLTAATLLASTKRRRR
jgi:formylglycine-generating enzyme